MCSKTPESENLVWQTTGVSTGFTSGGSLASPRPLEASYPKYLVSSKDSLEPSLGGQQEKQPPLQGHHLAPIGVKFQRVARFSPRALLPSPAFLLFHVCGKGTVSILGFSSLPRLAVNSVLQKDTGTLLSCILHFEKRAER